MTFDPTENYDDNKVLLDVSGEYAGLEVEAYCSPDSKGELYFSDGEMVNEDVGTPTLYQMRYGAPFDFDIVLVNDVYPQEGQVEELAEALGQAFEEEFQGKVDAVYELIDDSDDPLQDILDMEPDDLVVAPEAMPEDDE